MYNTRQTAERLVGISRPPTKIQLILHHLITRVLLHRGIRLLVFFPHLAHKLLNPTYDYVEMSTLLMAHMSPFLGMPKSVSVMISAS